MYISETEIINTLLYLIYIINYRKRKGRIYNGM